jgi:steroid delta-isomerase
VTAGAPGQEVVINIIDIFKFNGDGKIATMRAFWGPSNMTS